MQPSDWPRHQCPDDSPVRKRPSRTAFVSFLLTQYLLLSLILAQQTEQLQAVVGHNTSVLAPITVRTRTTIDHSVPPSALNSSPFRIRRRQAYHLPQLLCAAAETDCDRYRSCGPKPQMTMGDQIGPSSGCVRIAIWHVWPRLM